MYRDGNKPRSRQEGRQEVPRGNTAVLIVILVESGRFTGQAQREIESRRSSFASVGVCRCQSRKIGKPMMMMLCAPSSVAGDRIGQ